MAPVLQTGVRSTTLVFQYSGQESNLQSLGLKPSRSADGVPEHQSGMASLYSAFRNPLGESSPGRNRTADRLFVGQLPYRWATGLKRKSCNEECNFQRDQASLAEAVGLEPTNV